MSLCTEVRDELAPEVPAEGKPEAPHERLARWELWELIPGAPRRWSELGSPFDGIAGRRGWRDAAAAVLGFPVVLDCGENGEVRVVRASPMPQND